MAFNFKTKFVQNVQTVLEKIGIRIIRAAEYYEYKTKMGEFSDLKRWTDSSEFPALQKWVLSNMHQSKAQLQQDLVAQFICKSGGYFVEFGATNGIDLSNTFLLEKTFKWKGILAEPGRTWHRELSLNRSQPIDHRAVAGISGQVRRFVEANQGEYSTFGEFASVGTHKHIRVKSRQYDVETISLNDLLIAHGAPKHIQLISIDTEGSELEIIQSFDFDLFKVDLFFIEHNFSENQRKINSLLAHEGYFCFLTDVSSFDGWYIREELAKNLN